MLRPDELDLLKSTPGAVLAVVEEGVIGYASPDALHMLGWDADLIGKPLHTIIPERLKSRHHEGFTRYLRTGKSNLHGKTVRVPAQRRDGSEKELDLTIRVLRRPDGTQLAAAALSVAATGMAPPGLVQLESALTKRLYELV